MSKHKRFSAMPLPWRIADDDPTMIEDANGEAFASVYVDDDIPLNQAVEAARLMAAAPDLLEALKTLVVAAGNGHPGEDSYWAAVKAAESAIAKAECKE